jgi:RNA polymerase sigma-70 factor (ECF subfamily)
VSADDLESVLSDVFRREWSRLVSTAVRILGDFDAAEEVVQEAMVAALDRWPFSGVPDNPGAWLTVTARNRALNRLRDEGRARRREAEAAMPVAAEGGAFDATAFDDGGASPGAMAFDDAAAIPDDRLGLILTCCHPALGQPAQVALTLRLIAGLTTAEIARAFVVPEATIAQRVVRAKRLIRDRRIPYLAAGRAELEGRLPAVLAVVYLIFNEGYLAAAGDRLVRGELCDEARRLGALLGELLPAQGEVHGLVALMEFQSSRRGTRVDDHGELVLLEDQDRSRWDHSAIAAGELALGRALTSASGSVNGVGVGAGAGGSPGAFTLQAAVAACHALAPSWEQTDWPRILSYYDELCRIDPSPVVELNRAVAVCLVEGPESALVNLDRLSTSSTLGAYHPLVATRADVLRRLGRETEAAHEYRRAATLTANEVEQRFLLRRAEQCRSEQSLKGV